MNIVILTQTWDSNLQNIRAAKSEAESFLPTKLWVKFFINYLSSFKIVTCSVGPLRKS
jgi:hypothetical protein